MIIASGFEHTTKTNGTGEFRFDELRPGEYRIKASAPGFAETVISVRVAVSAVPTVSIMLQPRKVEQKVQVQGVGLLRSLLSSNLFTSG